MLIILVSVFVTWYASSSTIESFSDNDEIVEINGEDIRVVKNKDNWKYCVK